MQARMHHLHPGVKGSHDRVTCEKQLCSSASSAICQLPPVRPVPASPAFAGSDRLSRYT
jgi:hypothetical protein